ncbi:MAG: NADH-quinone oxidoreductase subunit N [Bacteroidota bacterium]
MNAPLLEYLTQQLAELGPLSQGLLPEWILTISIILTLLLSLFPVKKQSILWLAQIGLLLALGANLLFPPAESMSLFGGMLSVDGIAQYARILILGTTFIVFAMDGPAHKRKEEYYPLVLGVALGASIASLSFNLLTAILAVELISLVSYVLVGLEDDNRESAYAALQYLLFGLLTTGMSLYGLSWLYGMTGSFELGTKENLEALAAVPIWTSLPILLLTLSTFFFKLAAFPFHFWTPQVYRQVSYPLLALLSTLPKIAGTLFLLRIVHVLQDWAYASEFSFALLILALFSMTWGNLSALNQKHFKSVMAYSGIAQAGYFLLGLGWMSLFGESSVLFYLGIYVLINILPIISAMSLDREGLLDNFSGKGQVNIWASLGMAIGLVGLAGLPPTAGFIGKWFLFSAGVEHMTTETQNWILFVLAVAVLNTLISLFYYLKPLIMLFLRPRIGKDDDELKTSMTHKGLIAIISLLILTLGVYGFDDVMDYLGQVLWK